MSKQAPPNISEGPADTSAALLPLLAVAMPPTQDALQPVGAASAVCRPTAELAFLLPAETEPDEDDALRDVKGYNRSITTAEIVPIDILA